MACLSRTRPAWSKSVRSRRSFNFSVITPEEPASAFWRKTPKRSARNCSTTSGSSGCDTSRPISSIVRRVEGCLPARAERSRPAAGARRRRLARLEHRGRCRVCRAGSHHPDRNRFRLAHARFHYRRRQVPGGAGPVGRAGGPAHHRRRSAEPDPSYVQPGRRAALQSAHRPSLGHRGLSAAREESCHDSSGRVEPFPALFRSRRIFLARRTLRNVAVRISIVVAVATVVSFWHVRTGVERQAIVKALSATSNNGACGRALFSRLASGNIETFATAYRQAIRQTDPREAEQRFSALFESRDDGTTRLTADVFQAHGVTGFIGRNVPVDRDLKRRLVAAFDLVAQFGPAWARHAANSTWFHPRAPSSCTGNGQPWALRAGEWEVRASSP